MTLYRRLQYVTNMGDDSGKPPRAILVDHVVHCVSTIFTYRSHYTMLRTSAPMVGLVTAIFSLVFNLDYSTSASDAFHQAVIALSEMSLSWPMTLSMLYGVEAVAKQFNITIPAVTAKFIIKVQVQTTEVPASDWPIPASLPNAKGNGREGTGPLYLEGIDAFLEKLSLGK